MQLAFSGLARNANSVLIASTPALAAVARHEFSQQQLASAASWLPPQISTLDAWLTSLWRDVRFAQSGVPALLSRSQELALWKEIIAAHNPTLFDPDSMARLARQAAALILEWQIPLDDPAWDEHADGGVFKTWWREFRTRCRDSKWITRADLFREIPRWMDRGWITPAPATFLGWDRLSPSMRELVSRYESKVFGFPDDAPKGFDAFECVDEIDFAARWARARFENGCQSIGVFVPGLASERSRMKRVFRDVFHGFEIPERADYAFRLSAPEPLIENPIASSALLLLELCRPEFEQQAGSAILRCPFITGAAAERSLRAAADNRLKNDREPVITLRHLSRAARECPLFQKRLGRVSAELKNIRPQQKAHAWAELFAGVLNAIGWLGDENLNRDEEEIVDAWKAALSEFVSLSLVTPQLTLSDALERLRAVVASQTGAEVGSMQSPVEIIDVNDAAGIRFDAAIVLGLSQETWPPPPRVSPLIPTRLQAQAGVPGAGISGFRDVTAALNRAVLNAAPQIAGTFKGQISSLVRPYARIQSNADIWRGPTPVESFTRGGLEEVEDTQAPAYQDVEGVVAGGTGILKRHSNCPFQSFTYRLGVREVKDATFGYDALDRGNYVHASLQVLWNRLENSERLQDIAQADLESLIHDSVSEALMKDRPEDSPFALQTWEAERDRIARLLLTWLEEEKKRPQPFTVELTEAEREVTIDRLRLKIRIDRMDRLQDGSVMLIDYKTGLASKKNLACPRPAEPQLLVYAATCEQPVHSVSFACLRPDEMKLHEEEWTAELASEASDELARLAQDFLSGHAAVDPKKPDSCNYCEARLLCRVSEIRK